MGVRGRRKEKEDRQGRKTEGKRKERRERRIEGKREE